MSVLQEKFKAIADKIREKTGSTELIVPNTFVNEIDNVYLAGEKKQTTFFWDKYQNYGKREDYNHGFSEWFTDIFTPQYDISPMIASYIFYNSHIDGDLRQILTDKNVKLDLSKTKNISYGFKYSNFTALPELNLSSVTDKSYHVFQYCDKLQTIDKIIITSVNQNNIVLNHAFDGCTALTDIIIEMTDKTDDNGIIQDVAFPDSPLSRDSIVNIISLFNPLRSLTLTLSESAVINAFGSIDNEEWLSLIDTKPKLTIALK